MSSFSALVPGLGAWAPAGYGSYNSWAGSAPVASTITASDGAPDGLGKPGGIQSCDAGDQAPNGGCSWAG
jgi:hypothetical protein